MSRIGSLHQFMAQSLLAAAVVGSGLVEPALSTPLPQPNLQMMQIGASRSDNAADQVNGLAVIGLALAGSAAIGLGLTAVVERKRSSRLSWGTGNTSLTPSAPARLDQISSGLQRKLLRLLHDDQGAVKRLFTHMCLKYPGNTANWYAEKIIYDLERDRGRY
jgi:hypothetical protein